jgi:hypothetical protein
LTSGAKLVIALLGSIALVTILVIVGFMLFEPEGQPCATDQLAQNPLDNGVYGKRVETFDDVETAESFICHSVPGLHADDWHLESIRGERTVPTEFLVEGEGIGFVSLTYTQTDSSGRSITLSSAPLFTRIGYFGSLVPPDATSEPVMIKGLAGTAYRFGVNPDAVTVIWQDGTLEHQATSVTGEGFTLQGLVALLETAE